MELLNHIYFRLQEAIRFQMTYSHSSTLVQFIYAKTNTGYEGLQTIYSNTTQVVNISLLPYRSLVRLATSKSPTTLQIR